MKTWFITTYKRNLFHAQSTMTLISGQKKGNTKKREPIWPSGKAEGPLFESALDLLSLQKLWFVDTVL